ncbi:MAG: hypothetical protein ACXU8N_00660 [Telluria sp.]
MSHFALAALAFLILTIAWQICLPFFLASLREQAPAAFARLGAPTRAMLTARSPSHFRMQWRFWLFVLGGEPMRVLSGRGRALAALMWCSYAGVLALLAACAIWKIAIASGYVPNAG